MLGTALLLNLSIIERLMLNKSFSFAVTLLPLCEQVSTGFEALAGGVTMVPGLNEVLLIQNLN